MGDAYYIMLINVALAVMLLLGFAGFWFYDRKRKAALFFLLATMCFLASTGLELSAKLIPEHLDTQYRFILYSVNLMAGTLLTIGVTLQYRMKPYYVRMGLFYIVGVVLTFAILELPRQSVLRLCLNQSPIVVAISIGAIRMLLMDRKRTMDWLLVFALSAFALNLAARPAILAIYGSMGSSIAEYQSTQYAVVVQFSLTIVTMTTATILMLVMISDLVIDLMKQNMRDSMTGLLNRRGFDTKAREFLNDCAETGTDSVMIMSDIDHFKHTNDTYGHDAGDKVISYFGRMLGNIKNDRDVASRLGGEEFCLMLWDCDLEEGHVIAESIRETFHQQNVPDFPRSYTPSASFGIAVVRPGESLEQLYRRADKAVYSAKEAGRNRVSISTIDKTMWLSETECMQAA